MVARAPIRHLAPGAHEEGNVHDRVWSRRHRARRPLAVEPGGDPVRRYAVQTQRRSIVEPEKAATVDRKSPYRDVTGNESSPPRRESSDAAGTRLHGPRGGTVSRGAPARRFDPDSVTPLALGAITSATLTAYDARLRTLEMWTILGSVSTLSHGVALGLTPPLSAIAGSSATASASTSPRIRSLDPAELRPYARFPQGLPSALDRRNLRQNRRHA